MNKFLIAVILLMSTTVTNAQQNLDASLIPKNLLSHANAVVRDFDETIEVKDLDNCVTRISRAVTVLNKNGDEDAHIEIYYDKNETVKDIRGIVYNEFGKPVAKFSEKNFADENVADGFSLFESERVKNFLPSVTEYPYTIAYAYELRSKQTLGFDSWRPIENSGESVERANFQFSCQPDFNIKYKQINLPGKATVTTDRHGEKTYQWQVSNLESVRDEPFSPYISKNIPIVEVAPEQFSYYGIAGSYDSWKDLGKWIYDKLVSNRQQLPPQTIEKVKELTSGISDPYQKAKKIYEYMQGRTHYVSIQVGIGGLEPFQASDVDQQGYGDCKALVNYTQALLKAAGINSYYCVVQADDDYKVGMQTDFPSIDQGNHIILCIPFKNDTTWADCTSQTIPFGYLGAFTDDRTVLACTPDGGILLHTPIYGRNDNLKNRAADFTISTTGELSGTMTTIFKGVDYDMRNELLNEAKTDQDKILRKIYPMNNLNILHYELKQDKSVHPSTVENIKLDAPEYASPTDGKIYFPLNPVYRDEGAPPVVRNRQNDVYFARGYADEDDITYTIPAGYRLEKEPLNFSATKPFGKFTAAMSVNGDKITYKRSFQLTGGTYSKDTYNDVVDFFQDVADADGYTVSLVKN